MGSNSWYCSNLAAMLCSCERKVVSLRQWLARMILHEWNLRKPNVKTVWTVCMDNSQACSTKAVVSCKPMKLLWMNGIARVLSVHWQHRTCTCETCFTPWFRRICLHNTVTIKDRDVYGRLSVGSPSLSCYRGLDLYERTQTLTILRCMGCDELGDIRWYQ